MGVSEKKGYLICGPYNKDPTIWGTIEGSPIFGNSQLGVRQLGKPLLTAEDSESEIESLRRIHLAAGRNRCLRSSRADSEDGGQEEAEHSGIQSLLVGCAAAEADTAGLFLRCFVPCAVAKVNRKKFTALPSCLVTR